MSTELIVLNKNCPFIPNSSFQRRKFALAPKNQHKTTSDNNLKEKRALTLNLSCIPIERKQFAHTSHIQVRENPTGAVSWTSIVTRAEICLSWIQKTSSTTTVFHRQQIRDQQRSIPEFSKAFVLYNDEQTINRMITAKAIESFTRSPNSGF
jgi:hypothetical protein